jgi:hypothetical protein
MMRLLSRRLAPAGLLVLPLLLPAAARAQGGLSRVPLGYGVSVSIPAGWTRLGESDRTVNTVRHDSALVASGDPLLQRLTEVPVVVILSARAPRGYYRAITMNLTRYPEEWPGDLSSWGAEEVATATEQMCEALRHATIAFREELVECGKGRKVQVAGRTVLILEYAHITSAGQPVHSWQLRYPTRGSLLTLVLKVAGDRAANVEELYESIWQSVELP